MDHTKNVLPSIQSIYQWGHYHWAALGQQPAAFKQRTVYFKGWRAKTNWTWAFYRIWAISQQPDIQEKLLLVFSWTLGWFLTASSEALSIPGKRPSPGIGVLSLCGSHALISVLTWALLEALHCLEVGGDAWRLDSPSVFFADSGDDGKWNSLVAIFQFAHNYPARRC